MSKFGKTAKLTVSITDNGDVITIYSPEMRCEFPVSPANLSQALQDLAKEWLELQQENGDFTEAPPYSLLIGGNSVEEAHSVKHFESESDRLTYWVRRCSKEYAWLPFRGAFLPDTDENIRRVKTA